MEKKLFPLVSFYELPLRLLMIRKVSSYISHTKYYKYRNRQSVFLENEWDLTLISKYISIIFFYLVDVEPIEKDWRVFVRHEIVGESVDRDDGLGHVFRILFVVVNNLHHPLRVVMRVQDLVQPRVPLLLVQELDQGVLRDDGVFAFSTSSETIVNLEIDFRF